jgi:hypothetical protein
MGGVRFIVYRRHAALVNIQTRTPLESVLGTANTGDQRTLNNTTKPANTTRLRYTGSQTPQSPGPYVRVVVTIGGNSI